MSRLVLDTNRYADFARGDTEIRQVVEDAQAAYLPFVVVGELRAGFRLGTRLRENEAGLEEFLGSPGVGVLYPDYETTHHYALIYEQLRRHGRLIPTNDIWIAALAVQHDLILVARDEHFDRLPQLRRL